MRNGWMLYLCALFVLVFPAAAFANIPLPSLFGFGAPFFLSLRTVGAVFVAIVLLEATIIHYGTKIKWTECLLPVFLANLLTSILGLFAVTSIGLLVLLVVTYVAIRSLGRQNNIPWYFAVPLVLLPIVTVIAWIGLTWPEGRGASDWSMYCSLIPAFILTVIIEIFILAKWLSAKRLVRWTILANGASYMLLAILMFMFSYTQRDNPMMTYHYLLGSIESMEQTENIETPIMILDMMHELNKEMDLRALFLERELEIANKYAKYGYREKAREIFDQVKEIIQQEDCWSEELERGILEIEQILFKELIQANTELFQDLWLARDLAVNDFIEQAGKVLERVKSTIREDENVAEEIKLMIEEIEAIISKS